MQIAPQSSKCSKTDQSRVDCQVVLEKTGDDLCPVAAFLNYLVIRGDRPGALFQWPDGTPLFKTRVEEAIRQALTEAHFPIYRARSLCLDLSKQ